MKNKTEKLYSFANTDGTTGYGTHVGTDSQNRYLIEIKGSGDVRPFNKTELEEVLPFTFEVKTDSGTTASYVGDPGKMKVGDFWILHSTMRVVRIVAVNTKNASANKTFSGTKLETSISLKV